MILVLLCPTVKFEANKIVQKCIEVKVNKIAGTCHKPLP